MTVIVTSCAEFGLTVSGAKKGIMGPQTKGGGHMTFTGTAAGQVYNPPVEFVYLGGAISADWDFRSVEVTRRSRGHGRASGGTRWIYMTVRVCIYA